MLGINSFHLELPCHSCLDLRTDIVTKKNRVIRQEIIIIWYPPARLSISVNLNVSTSCYQHLEHSLPYLRNLIGQFQGTKSLSSPQLSYPIFSSSVLISMVAKF